MMNIAKMMQQAKSLQEKMQTLQEQLGDIVVEGSSGAGLIKISMTCKGLVQSIFIDPSLMVESEKEVLEDLLKAAMNDVRGKADAKQAEETQKLMTSMGLPAGMANGGLPF